MASKILVVAAYRRKLEEIASQPGVRLVAVAPPAWREPGGPVIRVQARPTPRPAARLPEGVPTIGFVARLVEEKGVWVLLEALRELPGDWRVHVIGSGPLARPARRRAQQLGLAARITWEPSVPSLAVADRLRTFSVLVQ